MEQTYHDVAMYILALHKEDRDVRRAVNRPISKLLAALKCQEDDVDPMDIINDEALVSEYNSQLSTFTFDKYYMNALAQLNGLKRTACPKPLYFLRVKTNAAIINMTHAQAMNKRRFAPVHRETLLNICSFVPDAKLKKLFITSKQLSNIARSCRVWCVMLVSGAPQVGKDYVAERISTLLNLELGEGTAAVSHFSDYVKRLYCSVAKVDYSALKSDPELREIHRAAIADFWTKNVTFERYCQAALDARDSFVFGTIGLQAPNVLILADWRNEDEKTFFMAKNVPVYAVQVTCDAGIIFRRMGGVNPRDSSAHETANAPQKFDFSINNTEDGTRVVDDAFHKCNLAAVMTTYIKSGMSSSRT
eukprot:PhF_6_TR3753/c0_g1_i1/m.5422